MSASTESQHEDAQRLTGTVIGTIVVAGVLTVAGADEEPAAFNAGAYAFGTVFVFWLAHGWALSLGRRSAGRDDYGLTACLRHELPVLTSVLAPLIALSIVAIAGDDDEVAITVATWTCVAELGLFGAGIARREGAPPMRIVTSALGCAALGGAIILLKAFVH